MALRVAVCRALSLSGFRGPSLRTLANHTPVQRVQPKAPVLRYSTEATHQLLKAVDTELKLERKVLDPLPEIPGFQTTLAGPVATLTRQHGNTMVKVEMDANHSIEATPEESIVSDGDSEEEEDEIEPMFVPAFTVTMTKPSGDSVQFECSFEELGPYLEEGRAWESLRVDSVSVVPATGQDDLVYSADTRNLSDALYSELMEYLKEHGIDEEFTESTLEFYKTFEHNCYCSNFLEELQKFLR